jgi:hypothetical protein
MLLLQHMEHELSGIDLTPRWQDFAVYLPALQFHYASAVDRSSKLPKERDFPKGIKLSDLDFLNPKSKLWHYGFGLYSAGQFDSARPAACAVTNRDRSRTIVLGDSGGYQIGVGTLKGTEHFKKTRTSSELCQLWRDSGDIRRRLVSWLDTHADYAMTIDMPLWAREPNRKGTPFHKCSAQELIDLSVENLEYIKRNTNGKPKWLNVLQGTEPADSKQWWDAVKSYRLGGWALAGTVGWRGGLENVLYYVMTMRDDNAFERGQDWLHVLGVSMPSWAVLLTAIQRAIRKHCENPNLRVSYDSASPFQAGGRYQKVVRYPKFTREMSSWVMTMHEAPINPMYANDELKRRFPYPSPIGDLITLDQLNVRGGEFQKTPWDSISNHILTNHNVWVYVRSFLEANELAFMHPSEAQKAVPQKLLDACALIDDLFADDRWQAKLKKHKKLLTEVFSTANPKDVVAEDELR